MKIQSQWLSSNNLHQYRFPNKDLIGSTGNNYNIKAMDFKTHRTRGFIHNDCLTEGLGNS